MPASIGRKILRGLKWLGGGLLILIVSAAIVGAIYEAHGRYGARRDYPAIGALVDIGGRRMQLDCRGSGTPTVVFEAGLDTMGSLSWSAVHDAIAKETRACAYSRAGIMWSDPAPEPTSAVAVAKDLHATLAAAHEAPPFVMVGHSLGGPYIMEFTKQFGPDVAGLVFVDASHPEQVKRLREIVGRDLDEMPFIFRMANLLVPVGVTRAFMPKDEPAHVPEQAMAMAVAYAPTSFGPMMAEGREIRHTLDEAGTLRTLGDRPIAVLTAMKPLDAAVLESIHITREQGDRFQQAWLAMHDDEASWSTHSVHRQFTDSTHYIQFDRPDAVIAAVHEVVGQVRAPK